jgi:hypothetical protein
MDKSVEDKRLERLKLDEERKKRSCGGIYIEVKCAAR